jgi:hypothetical protein
MGGLQFHGTIYFIPRPAGCPSLDDAGSLLPEIELGGSRLAALVENSVALDERC